MAKQRFVVYKAFDKHGEEQRQLLVAGGHLSIFCGGTGSQKDINTPTTRLMSFSQGHLAPCSTLENLGQNYGCLSLPESYLPQLIGDL